MSATRCGGVPGVESCHRNSGLFSPAKNIELGELVKDGVARDVEVLDQRLKASGFFKSGAEGFGRLLSGWRWA